MLSNSPCRDQIRENVLLKQYYCDVDVGHLISFNEELAHRLVTEPAEIIPLVSAEINILLHILTPVSSKVL
jgi:DNA replication licensing factor MCM5